MSAPEAEVDRSAREGVERELLAWMSEAKPSADAERFERLALALFRFQFTACAPYARLCASLDRTPDRVEQVSDIPAVPTGAFKEFDLRCFPEDQTTQVFRTSGTSVDRRGALHLDSVVLYEASLLASLRHSFLPGLVGTRPEMRFLSPRPAEAPDSSLTHMFEALRLAEGHPSSDYDLREGRLDLHAFEAAVERAGRADRPLIVAGTSFAFVHFLDDPQAAGETRWHLPAGSRVMETGGFKGRSRTVPREVLRSEIATRFGLDERAVVNQYGMTELGSQFYDSTLVDPDGPRRKEAPPWTRVRFVDGQIQCRRRPNPPSVVNLAASARPQLLEGAWAAPRPPPTQPWRSRCTGTTPRTPSCARSTPPAAPVRDGAASASEPSSPPSSMRAARRAPPPRPTAYPPAPTYPAPPPYPPPPRRPARPWPCPPSRSSCAICAS